MLVLTDNRYIGEVLKFGTKTSDQYGFIEYKEANLFFHRNNILKVSKDKIDRFYEIPIVTYKVRESKKNPGKLEAYEVTLLEDEKDTEFLLDQFFWHINTKKTESITLSEITSVFYGFNKEDVLTNKALYKNHLLNSLYMKDTGLMRQQDIVHITQLYSSLFDSNESEIFELLIKLNLFGYINELEILDLKEIFNRFIEYFNSDIQAANRAASYLIESYPQSRVHYFLWLDGFNEEAPLDYITNNFVELNEDYAEGFLHNVDPSQFDEAFSKLLFAIKSDKCQLDTYRKVYKLFTVLQSAFQDDRVSSLIPYIKISDDPLISNCAIPYQLWADGFAKGEPPVEYIANNIFTLNKKFENGFLHNIEDHMFDVILDKVLDNFKSNKLHFSDYQEIFQLFKLLKTHGLDTYISILLPYALKSQIFSASYELPYRLWMDGFSNDVPVDYIADNIFQLNEKFEKGFLHNIEKHQFSEITDKILENFKNNKLHFNSYHKTAKMLRVLQEHGLEKVITLLIPYISQSQEFDSIHDTYYKLWIDGFVKDPPIDSILNDFSRLNSTYPDGFLHNIEEQQYPYVIEKVLEGFENNLVGLKNYSDVEQLFKTLNILGLQSYQDKFIKHIIESEDVAISIYPEDLVYKLWLDSFIKDFPIQSILDNFSKLNRDYPNGFLHNIEESQYPSTVEKVLKGFENKSLDLNTYDDVKCLFEILNNLGLQSYQNEFVRYIVESDDLATSLYSEGLTYQLWLDGYSKKIPVKYIIKNFFEINAKHHHGFLHNIPSESTDNIIKEVFDSFKKKNIEFTTCNQVVSCFQVLSNNNLSHLISSFFGFVSTELRIRLWLQDSIEYFDFTSYAECLSSLDDDNQQMAVKKIFHMAVIHRQTFALTLESLEQMNVTDYTTRIVFELIKKVAQSERVNKYSLKGDILKLISTILNNSEDLLSLDGYFPICSGRIREKSKKVSVNYAPGYINEFYLDESDREVEYVSYGKFHSKPIFCEGRLSTSKNNTPNLSNGGNNYFWCRNLPCFNLCRDQHDPKDWHSYDISDFLKILNISFNRESLELLYATINKVNNFLLHLNCRDCQRVLTPTTSSHYGFDRTTRFQCLNEYCTNNEVIYLSHCSNSKCESVIDSRNSKQCPNRWYICMDCFACCDDKGLERRNSSLKHNNHNPSAHIHGHGGKVIFCPNCSLQLSHPSPADIRRSYDEALRTFINLSRISLQPSEPRLVTKSGVNSHNARWFTVNRGNYTQQDFLNYLYYWESLGFNIPDLSTDTNRNRYLVSEPIKKESIGIVTHFNCNNCGFKRNYNQDAKSKLAVNYWHFDYKKRTN